VRRPRPFGRRRGPRPNRRSNRRASTFPKRIVAAGLAALLVPVALVLIGLREQRVARRGEPLVAQAVRGGPRVGTPLFSLRRIPATVAQPLVADPLLKKLDVVGKQLPASTCLAVEADGVALIEHEVDRALIPASNMKLITAAVAMEVIGPDYQFVTKMYGDISKSNPEQVFDLYIVGSGDPLISTPRYREASKQYQYYVDTPWTALDDLVEQLKAKGITRVAGDVYADSRRYDMNDLGVVSTSVSPIGAFVANDSLGDYTPGVSGRAKDPALHAASQLVAMLDAGGIKISPVMAPRKVKLDDEPSESYTFLGELKSAPLKDIVANMLTRSDNDTAEMLMREIAVRKGKPGNSAGAVEAVREVLASWGVPLEGVSQSDGSGLARENQLTCRALMGVLRRVGSNSDIARGLPVPGRGTLVDRFGQCPVRDTLSAKTGTLAGVRSLSGFVTAIGGHVITFSLLMNDTSEQPANRVFAAICDSFAAFPGRLDLVAFGPADPLAA
jgi:serine-type D-Ala-D-Ala carboxypeptidase/endopeptidase (penicillin-binding protein 4)